MASSEHWRGRLWLRLQWILSFPFRPLAKFVGGNGRQPLGQMAANGATKNGKGGKKGAQRAEYIERLQEAQIELERAQKSVQFLQFQIEEKEDELGQLKEQMAQMAEEKWRKEREEEERENGKMEEELKQQLEGANARIEEMMSRDEEKRRTIQELEEKLRQAVEVVAAMENRMAINEEEENRGEESEENIKTRMDEMRTELAKLEEKLANATEEKEYYKKHFKGEQNGTENYAHHNGKTTGYTDDFAKELMMANKRKYQLESRVKQLEMERKETQQKDAFLSESLKNTEKLLWLEKERSATLEMEREKMNGEMEEMRRNRDGIKRELEELRGEKGDEEETASGGGKWEEEMNRMRADSDQRRVNELMEMKNKMEWRLGEVQQMYNDTKWRLGEIESTLAHRDWQLDQANNRIKLLEGSFDTSDSARLSDELNRIQTEFEQKMEEKAKVEWRLGEVTQWWNDAKWRLGELEAESAHRSQLLDQAHHKIGELERRLEGKFSLDELRPERTADLERKIAELDKAYNDSQWTVGELKAEVHRLRGEKEHLARHDEEKKAEITKMECRLGEMTQSWNDAKWRIGELESIIMCLEREMAEIKAKRSNAGENDERQRNEQLDSLKSEGAMMIRKQPHMDRHKWNMLTIENALQSPFKRVWFETDSSGGKQVFLIGSFTNWECALLCEPIPEKPNRIGIWVDLPSEARHEFRFFATDSREWQNSRDFEQCWNEHGTKNYWIYVS